MPIYGYRCDECGHEFETFQNMSDPPMTVCPNCKGKLRKQVYPVGIAFKGSGFYTTDYKSTSAGSNGAKGDSSESSSTEKKPESKPESKPETKSDSGSTGGSSASSD
jgi:putative FmdB family regulatory protein